MNKFKKALSVGMSAALLASLFTVIAASTVSAQTTTVTGGGPINPGGAASAPITIHATEDVVTDWPDPATGTITLTDAAGGATITFTGTPVVVASGGPAPFACSAVLATAGTQLVITCTGATLTRLDSFTITGLSIKAATGAALGGVIATWAGTLTLGTSNVTASGALYDTGNVLGVTGNAVAQDVAIRLDAGSAAFQVTSATPPPSKAHVAGGAPEDVSITIVAAPAAGVQHVTGAFLLNHVAGAVITETVVANQLTGLPVVGDAISLCDVAPSATAVATFTCPVTSPAPALVRQGLNNQLVNGILIDLGKLGFVAKDSTLTIAASAGGVFSNVPIVALSGGATATISAGVLSFDRSTITYTVTAKSTTDNDKIRLDNVRLDVAIGAAQGSVITATLTPAPAVAVVGNALEIAQVGSNLIGVGAVPNVLIGFNDQPTGLLTLTETAAGTLSDDVNGATNIVRVCLANYPNVFFLRQPWAVVTAGDLKVNSGGVSATQVKMTLSPGGQCASFLIFSQSTVASTVEIRGGVDAASSAPLASGPNNGPKISVTTGMVPGPVFVQVKQFMGVAADLTGVTGSNTGSPVVVAMATFSGSPAVTAVTRPVIARGGTGQAAGNITIAETQAGQFGATDEIDLCLVPRSLSFQQDVFFSTSSTAAAPLTANQPIVSTNNVTGLVAHFAGFTPSPLNFFQTNTSDCLTLVIDSAPASGLGMITVSNIHYDVVADAALGSVLLQVFNDDSSGPAAGSNFSQTVSNATVGSQIAGSAATRLGVTRVGAFTISTKVAALRHYVTYRFDFGVAAAGAHIDIWGATKVGNDWSAFSKVTTRVANASGVVYYYIRQNSATWKSYRAAWADSGVFTLARQARWR